MVPPIPLGTLLRQRYLIQAVLGQGGFGRTYLAVDQERFDERCVLKEFSVPYEDETLLKKSRALFQREASTLYKLQHPQVPRFWAAFEEEQRVFLVQEYADGQTYRQWLNRRKEQGKTFSEAEVRLFLAQMLPVLSYLHTNDIIHRDISPENIIVKEGPGTIAPGHTALPMLIDFGAVKQATLTSGNTSSAVTRVGKVGYAPPEQLQTGQVYPNSDLYSLAATCLVLLTGKEPRSLLDSQTLDWRWHIHTTITDEFGAILRRMLSVYPGDRYPSAAAVLATIQALAPLHPAGPQTEPPASQRPNGPPLDKTGLPQVFLPNPAALVAGHSPPPPATTALENLAAGPLRSRAQPFTERSHHPGFPPPFPAQASVRWGMLAAFVAGAAIAGSILWKVLTPANRPAGEVWVSGARLPQSEASRIIGYGSANSTVTPAPANAPDLREVPANASQPQTIEFSTGKIAANLEGNLGENSVQAYKLPAAEGQILTASLSGAGVVMNLLRSDQSGLDAAAYQTRSWTGQLPADDQYLIQVAGSGPYTLAVAVTPASRPTQDKIERVTFARGTNGTTVTGAIAPKQLRRYLLKANPGQLVLVRVLQGGVNFVAIAPNGQRIGGSSTNAKEWKGRLPSAGDYVIEVTANQADDYALSIEIF